MNGLFYGVGIEECECPHCDGVGSFWHPDGDSVCLDCAGSGTRQHCVHCQGDGTERGMCAECAAFLRFERAKRKREKRSGLWEMAKQIPEDSWSHHTCRILIWIAYLQADERYHEAERILRHEERRTNKRMGLSTG